MRPLLSVRDLSVQILKGKKAFPAVHDISFNLFPGEINGIVGESGCGKSLTALSITGLLPNAAEVKGSVFFTPQDQEQSRDLLKMSEKELCGIRGKEISMIFQEPISSLNPLQKIGRQICEVLEIHEGKKGSLKNKQKAIELMQSLGLHDAEKLMDNYPWMLSGGMCQRVMIALAMICGPRLLIADEPSTALDRNTQDEVLKLLEQINRESAASILFISHDLGLIKRLCHKVMVMYAGRIVEEGGVEEVFSHPAHEYTKGLLGALPERSRRGTKLKVIPGQVPSIEEADIRGCPFAPRCSKAEESCRSNFPGEVFINMNHKCRCITEAL